MKLNNLFTDEDAVSPVIGVILMVAITVILAAVIGAFVLGIGGSQETVPTASFSWEEVGTDHVKVIHEGGSEIPEDRLSFSDSGCGGFVNDGSGAFSAGDSAQCDNGQGSEISLVWSSSKSDQTSILSTYQG